MSDQITTMFAQSYSKKKPTLLSQQINNKKKSNGKKTFRK